MEYWCVPNHLEKGNIAQVIQVNIPGKSFLQWCHIVLQSEILDIEDIDAVDLTRFDPSAVWGWTQSPSAGFLNESHRQPDIGMCE